MECGFGRFRRTDDKRGVLNPTPERVLNPLISLSFGGRGGIRTHGTLAGTPVFKTGALNHSATLPSPETSDLAGVGRRGKCRLPAPIAEFSFSARHRVPRPRDTPIWKQPSPRWWPRFGETSSFDGPCGRYCSAARGMPVLPTDPRHDLCCRMTRSTCPACGPTPLHVGFFVPGSCKPDGFFATISRSAARARRLGGASLPLSRTFYCAP